MIRISTYDDMAAMVVLRDLDPQDRLEAEAVRGEVVSHLSLFGDWRAARGYHLLSLVIRASPSDEPVALLALANTGQHGVASAALVARNHRRYRRQLAALARLIRKELPRFASEAGIFRIEARAWASHPRASKFLSLVGFTHEVDMPGFGRGGTETFRQFAWIKEHCDVLFQDAESSDASRATDRGL